MSPATLRALNTRAAAVRLKAVACVLMHTVTLCYSSIPLLPCEREISPQSTVGFPEMRCWCTGSRSATDLRCRCVLPGVTFIGPLPVSAPRLSIARFRTRSRQRRGCVCRGCRASTPLSVHQVACSVRGLGGRLFALVRPGGISRGTLAALKTLGAIADPQFVVVDGKFGCSVCVYIVHPYNMVLRMRSGTSRSRLPDRCVRFRRGDFGLGK